MNADTIKRLGEIHVMTLSRPDVRNAVDSDTTHALHAAFLAFEDDANARVAVFHGPHGHFCAGWDLQHDARALSPMGPLRLRWPREQGVTDR
jgi:enoyl-CoA hydratase